MRAFVNAYPESRPAPGDGAHPALAWSGWRAEWDDELPATRAALIHDLTSPWSPDDAAYVTWNNQPGEHDDVPIGMVSWYVAFAFCAWDGGRLPTSAEWGYASVGGAEQRTYPWGNEVPTPERAVLRFAVPQAFEPVGSRPAGVGRFGQFDLGGSRWEWALDAQPPNPYYPKTYPLPCLDCATPPSDVATWSVMRDGEFLQPPGGIPNAEELADPRYERGPALGVRCARDVEQSPGGEK